jgi:hypothetical protein
MARTSANITQQEAAVYQQWCRANLVIWSANQNNPGLVEESSQNANVVAKYFQETWKNDITAQNLAIAFPHLRPHLKFFESAAQQRLNELTSTLDPHEHNALSHWFEHQATLVNTGDQAISNLEVLVNQLRTDNREFSVPNFNLVTTNLVNSKRQVFWKRKLQDSEIEAQRKREEAAAPSRPEQVSVSKAPELTLSPQMQAHRDMLHRQVEGAPAPRASDSELRREAEAVLLNTNSHVIREQAARILLANDGVVDWAATAKARAAHIGAAIARRQNVGR